MRKLVTSSFDSGLTKNGVAIEKWFGISEHELSPCLLTLHGASGQKFHLQTLESNLVKHPLVFGDLAVLVQVGLQSADVVLLIL